MIGLRKKILPNSYWSSYYKLEKLPFTLYFEKFLNIQHRESPELRPNNMPTPTEWIGSVILEHSAAMENMERKAHETSIMPHG